MTTVARYIAQRLVEAGTRNVFGMPGGGSLDVIEAVDQAGVPFVLSQTETGGAFMACAQAELTGSPGACLATMGPGATCIANGAAQALLDRTPLLIFTDRYAPPTRETYWHQRIDQQALLRPVSKWSAELVAEAADEILDRALATATAAPPGPVHLDCPAEVCGATFAPRRCAPGGAHSNPASPAGIPSERTFAALTPSIRDLIKHARRPLLVAGLGARQPEDAASIRCFCERRGIPAMVTYKAKGVVPDHHPLFAGVFTNGAIERPIVEAADLLIGVGLDAVELLPRPWTYPQPAIYGGRWAVQQTHVPFAATLTGDVPACIRALDELMDGSSDWTRSAVQAATDGQRAALRVRSERLAPCRVVEILATALGASARITVDAGAHMFPVVGLWPACEPGQILISNGLSTMGFALPAAIGSALLERDRPTVATTGDGGLLMCAGELKTVVREGLKILVIVFNDGVLSLIKIKQEQRGYRTSGVDIGEIDWQALAAAMGLAASRAESEGDLERAVDEWIGRGGPALVDVRVDPGCYRETLRAVRG